MPLLIVGLGNPGSKYDFTPHNIGFAVIDELARRLNAPAPRDGYKAKYSVVEGSYAGRPEKIFLVKPQTYMNLSGESVLGFVTFYKLRPADDVLVISDEMDLPPGTTRLRLSGSAGGHNGLKSLIGVLGEGFPRLRIGVGRHAFAPTTDYLLSKVPKAEHGTYAGWAEKGANAVELCLKEGIAKAMNSVNKKEPSNGT